MSELSVHANPVPYIRSAAPFVVSVQAGIFDTLPSRMLIPLYRQRPRVIVEALTPIVRFREEDFTLLTFEMTSFPVNKIGDKLGNLDAERYHILQAIDLLITGV